jgi:hypothetical protein
MQTYRITFYFKGNRYSETVGAGSSNAARRLIESRFIGCTIWNIDRL